MKKEIREQIEKIDKLYQENQVIELWLLIEQTIGTYRNVVEFGYDYRLGGHLNELLKQLEYVYEQDLKYRLEEENV